MNQYFASGILDIVPELPGCVNLDLIHDIVRCKQGDSHSVKITGAFGKHSTMAYTYISYYD